MGEALDCESVEALRVTKVEDEGRQSIYKRRKIVLYKSITTWITHYHHQNTARTQHKHSTPPFTMRAPSQDSQSILPRHSAKSISIAPTSTLHITLNLSILATPHQIIHTPVLLPSGVVSISPPYHSCSFPPQLTKREFIPHRPIFSPPASSLISSGEEKRCRHAALTAHLSAEMREDGGSCEGVGKECKRGRGGYNGPC